MPVYSLFVSPSGQDKLYQVKNFVFLNLCYSPSNSKVTGIQQALDEYKIKSFFLTLFCVCVGEEEEKEDQLGRASLLSNPWIWKLRSFIISFNNNSLTCTHRLKIMRCGFRIQDVYNLVRKKGKVLNNQSR